MAKNTSTFLPSFIVFCLLLSGAFAVYGNKGACETGNYTDVDVDWSRYLGKWYNVRVSSSFFFQSPSDQCTVANYSLNTDGSVKVDNQAVKENGSIAQAVGKATIKAAGHLKVSFSSVIPITANYEVVYLNDDYSVAAVVGCNGLWVLGTSNVWILARDYNVSNQEIELALNALETIGFDISDLISNGTSQCQKL